VIPDRRRSARVVPDADAPYCHIRLRTGAELTVLDIAPGGAFVESAARLLPGSVVEVQIRTCAGRERVRTRVVRSAVSGLRADAIRYRSGLAFERAIDLAPAHAISA
jgi:hypothetical protein